MVELSGLKILNTSSTWVLVQVERKQVEGRVVKYTQSAQSDKESSSVLPKNQDLA